MLTYVYPRLYVLPQEGKQLATAEQKDRKEKQQKNICELYPATVHAKSL